MSTPACVPSIQKGKDEKLVPIRLSNTATIELEADLDWAMQASSDASCLIELAVRPIVQGAHLLAGIHSLEMHGRAGEAIVREERKRSRRGSKSSFHRPQVAE